MLLLDLALVVVLVVPDPVLGDGRGKCGKNAVCESVTDSPEGLDEVC